MGGSCGTAHFVGTPSGARLSGQPDVISLLLLQIPY